MLKKSSKLLYLVIIALNMSVYGMEENKKTSWANLPVELKSYILAITQESKNITKIIDNLKSIGMVNKEFEYLARNLVAPHSADNVVKKYVQQYPEKAYDNFLKACAYGDHCKYAVKAFINGEINVEFIDDWNCKALNEASRWGNKEIVRILLEAKADVNSGRRGGATPLMSAAIGGQCEVAKKLIEAGANINAQNNTGDTALFHAAEFGYLEVVKLLLENGAELTLRNNKGETALQAAEVSFSFI